jgi:energy-coupling factor transporter transmembrane protein EcfT
MAYRYLFVLANAAGDLMQARFLRTVGQLETGANRRFMGHSAAHLFLKSHFLSGEIYDAMCCRGFTGKPVSLTKGKVAAKDVFFLVSNVLILLILIVEEILF